jgi:hypothetical protein
LEKHGATIRLTASGKIHNFAAAAGPVLRRLLDGTAHTTGELTATAGSTLSEETVRTLCATLVHLGLAAIAG